MSDKNDNACGEMSLDVLLKTMQPVLDDELYVFATVKETFDYAALKPRLMFVEKEGVSLIITKSQATDAGIAYEFPCRMITLNVHSSLEAVGFLARISNRLAAKQMGVNPVSGFYHDHLFIPEDRAEDAMAELLSMTES